MKITKKEFNELLKEVKKGYVITITDYSEYEAGKSNDGGAYSYTQRYEKLENGNWKLSYHTSSIFYYCEFCGTFQNGECSCNEEYEEVSLGELARILEYSWADPKHGVRIK